MKKNKTFISTILKVQKTRMLNL